MGNNESLTSKTRKGLLWSAFDSLGSQGIQFVFSIILARILAPEDYGLVAMPLIFLAIAQVFVDSGFSNALVRKPKLSDADLSTAFYFNIIVGFVCYAILFLCSPLIADFYNAPVLSSLLKVTALSTLFNPLCAVQQAILARDINFKKQAKITISATLFSGVVGVFMAYTGYGVWALVFQQVSGSLLRIIMLWGMSKWHPRSKWSRESFKYLWGYGSKVVVSGLLDSVYKNISPLLVGKFYTPSDLGYYTRAIQMTDLPSQNITSVLQRVTFPVLSTIQGEEERLVYNYRRIVRLSSFIIFPIMLLIAAVADPLIRILLTDKWEECILLLQLLCFSRILRPVHAVNVNILYVKGRSDVALKAMIVKKIITFTLMLCVLPLGIIYFVSSEIVCSFLILFVNVFFAGKVIDVSFSKQLRDIMPFYILSFAMFIVVFLFVSIIPSSYVQLIIGTALGCTIYITGAKIFKFKEREDVLNLMPASVREKRFIQFILR